MRKKPIAKILLILAGLVLLVGVAYQLPPIHRRLSWRVDFALTYMRGVLNPAGEMPTPLPQPQVGVTRQALAAAPTHTPISPTPLTPEPTATPSPTATPIPSSASLPAPAWEKQDANNCGPATLAMYLNYWGWEGDQFTISEQLKPKSEDRNVNVEELSSYVINQAGWLNLQYRVGGDLELLKEFLAAGLPVMIEESFYFDEVYWPNDDRWAAHYNLLTGYDDAAQVFTSQDSFRGADQKVPYTTLDEYWQSFNRVYILVYPPDRNETVKSILGEHWDPDANRQHALEAAQAETEADPQDAFAWFNVGSNLVYFERYDEAARAYDRAREIGLPQRMLRYQFGPFFAYFHSRRMDDLMALLDYALQRTPNSEEAKLWRGWALYRSGDTPGAVAEFQSALEENWNYQDAKYALNFVQENPRGK
jgi:tetratricopeptide (TPR) repeat protein